MRANEIGYDNRPPTADELERMRGHVRSGHARYVERPISAPGVHDEDVTIELFDARETLGQILLFVVRENDHGQRRR